MKTEALKLALEALKQIDAAMPFPVAKLAIKKAEEALAQPAVTESHKQEPRTANEKLARMKSELAYMRKSQPEQERCVGCEACIDTACGRDECPKGWPKAVQPEQEPVPAAMKTVIEAMQQDPDYAWGWHCNIAMSFVDAGGDHYTGNQGAARFMRTLANVEPAHELPFSPPQRTWVGLTDEEINDLVHNHDDFDGLWEFTDAVEAKLKEKNT